MTNQANSCDDPDLECDETRCKFRDSSSATSGEIVLSVFPGVDLLGRCFRESGFCVVTGPDLIVGDDVRQFSGIPNRFNGIIGGPPCQDFSCARMQAPTYDGYGAEMLQQYLRIVSESLPEWFLLENVPGVPDVRLDGYKIQRLDITDAECGGVQLRNRHVQFGHREGWIIRPERISVTTLRKTKCVTGNNNTTFAEACRRQGLSERLQLPGWSLAAKHQAIGNAVSMHVGRTLADAVTRRSPITDQDCPCGCGRTLSGRQKSATAACRKRLQRRRTEPKPVVTWPMEKTRKREIL